MAQTYQVSTLSELYEALAAAKGGETILLEGGNYGEMSLGKKSGFSTIFSNDVTIASADPTNPAIITNLQISYTQNVTFDGIIFDYKFSPEDEIYERPFSVSDSQNITIRNSTFDGDVASGVSNISDGYGYAIGLSLRETASITVENNEFFNFHRGMVTSQSSDVNVSGNDIHNIRSDGMDFAEVVGVVIENNYIHDFRKSPDSLDHCDMIQFWTNGTDSPSQDITIRNNHLDIGNGTETQSIFMRNEQVDRGLAGTEMFYQNILIENNVITNGHLHGITVGEATGLEIRNNTILHADGGNVDGIDSSVEIPRINVNQASTNVVIANNAVANINGFAQQPDWTVCNNAFVQDQDPRGFGFYGNEFVASSMNVADGVHAFSALPGGMLDRLNAGAATTLLQPGSGIVTAFHVESVAGNQALVRFDASYSQIDADDLPAGTRFLWSFGDGTEAEGLTADHAYVDGGKFDVTLSIVLPDGRSDSSSVTVSMQSSEVLSFVHGHGFVVNHYGTQHVIEQAAAVTADGLTLGANGAVAKIDHIYVDRILHQDAFEMSLSLAASKSVSQGEIMRLHGSFVTSVTETGELLLDVYTDMDERIILRTDGANLSDRANHDIDICLTSGILSITVDGTVLAQTEMAGGLASLGNRDLTFGNPWNKQNFEGIITDFNLNVNADDFIAARAAAVAAQTEMVNNDQPIVQLPAFEDAKAEDAASPTENQADSIAPDVFTTHLLNYVTGKGALVYPADTANFVIDLPDNAGGIDLGKKGVVASIDREHADDILGSDNFQIAMTLKADQAGSSGEVVRLHSSFVTSIDAKGEFFVQAFSTEEGRIRLRTEGAHLNDAKNHDISLTLDEGVLSITVDGQVMASAEMKGTLISEGRHDLNFGNSWGKANFDGHVSSFMIAIKDDRQKADSTNEKFAADTTPIFDHHEVQSAMDMMFDATSHTFSAYL